MKNVVNDFTINVATTNGTGSQSANLILLDAFFRMGLPVSGKNLFPSNIAGLPTWYILRISARGYQAPGDGTQIQVLMNPDTWLEDLAALPPGAVVVFNSDVNDVVERDDLVLYGAPMTSIAREFNPKLAKMVANIVFVGMLAELLGLPQECLDAAIAKQFAGKQKAIDLNSQAAVRGREYVRDELEKRDPYCVEPIENGNDGNFLVEGNDAVALGALYGGVALVSWYPITPSSSLAETIEGYLPRLRAGDDGVTCAVIQAEDEIAAIGMVLGAGWAGVRAMTCTSGPGISLMSEMVGLAYYAEVPAVIWDVNRAGPSTGLPTRTQQGDLAMVYTASHGDTQHLVRCGHAGDRLAGTILAQGAHAHFAGTPAQIRGRDLVYDHLPAFIIHDEHLEQAKPALVPGAVALVATFPGQKIGILYVVRIEAKRQEFTLLRFGRRFAFRANLPNQALRHETPRGRGDQERLHADIRQSGHCGGRVVGVECGENQMAGQRGIDGDGCRLVVTNLTQHHHVRRLAQHRPERVGESQIHCGVHLHLVDSPKNILHRILNRDDFFVGCIKEV
mgnify:CR=1 FL=1